jgi:small redox-active disulfide protein 2
VVAESGIEANITKVEDIMDIMSYGVSSTPALVVDGKVVLKGRLPSNSELKELLTK